MKHKRFTLLLTGWLLLTAGAGSAQETSLDNDTDKLSYALGLIIGERVRQRYESLNYELMLEAMRAPIGVDQARMTLDEAARELQTFEENRRLQEREATRKAGQAYLEANAARDEVTVTESGLQWEVLSQGEGEKPGIDDTIVVHYSGTLIDGTEFDSSLKRGQPLTTPLQAMIAGWKEGLQLMNAGSKYRFVIPSELAYGEQGAGQAVGPDETLVFEVELLEIK